MANLFKYKISGTAALGLLELKVTEHGSSVEACGVLVDPEGRCFRHHECTCTAPGPGEHTPEQQVITCCQYVELREDGLKIFKADNKNFQRKFDKWFWTSRTIRTTTITAPSPLLW